MDGAGRREAIIAWLEESGGPVSGMELAKKYGVSRQVIVQDIALIRSSGREIYSTHKGYVMEKKRRSSRVYKVIHEDDEVETELNTIVDLGGHVRDAFIYHKVYGVVKADIDIKSRLDVQRYMQELASGKSRPLKNVTGGYHYHTVEADSEVILDMIQEALGKLGFLAALQDYEPVDFWKEK